MRVKRLFFLLIFLILTFFVVKDTKADVSMLEYCYTPPSIAQSVKPNVLFVMDFSGSMQYPAYVPCSFSDYNNNKVAKCNSNDANYDSSKTYYGYFDPDKCYCSSSNAFQESSCSCSKSSSLSSCISGNLLNWISMTRIDVTRKVLTGGRQTSSQNSTYLESEGATYTITDNNLGCVFDITAVEPSNRSITIKNASSKTCPLGNNTINNVSLKIKPEDPSTIKGIIHDFCDVTDLNGQINEKCKVIMEFMVFASDNRQGEVKVGKNATISNLINAINNETPYWGTPTGEALWEAYDYYKQSDEHNYEKNSAYINKGKGNVDPYYDVSGPNTIPVSCRKSFVLLLSDGVWNGDVDPVVPARSMATTDLRDDLDGIQNVFTYTVYAFGDLDLGTRLQGKQAMITTAIFGGFNDKDKNTWPYPFTNIPADSKAVVYPLSKCNPNGNWDSECSEWDTLQNGLPYNFYEAEDAESLRQAILNALFDILKRASSGSAVGMLASRTGISSLVVQPYFYPKYLKDDGTEIGWLGFLRSFWIDLKQNLREDTVVNKILDMAQNAWDKIIQFMTVQDKTKIAVLTGDTDTGTNACSLEAVKDLDQVIPVFNSSCWLANIDASSRNIRFNKDGTLTSFTTDAASYLAGIWQTTVDSTINPTKASCIIRYLRGENLSGDATCGNLDYVKRSRELNIGNLCGVNQTKTWKLGDTINSTPSVVSDQPVNIYHIRYADNSYSEFIKQDSYKNRPTITFVGANDGMLHAFRTGTVVNQTDPEHPTKLQNAPNDTGTNKIGQEEWAFIPKNAIPYLIWYGHNDYCHVPTVDYRTMVFDAKIGGTWKTILIGVMGFGGKAIGAYSSSVFVFNITDPTSPELLWEKTLDNHTLTLSFPAVVVQNSGANWYLVIGSGPLNPNGTSFTTANIYFFNLSDGSPVKTLTVKEGNNKVTAAVGDIMSVDVDNDYSDDVIYFGTYTTNSGNFYRIPLKTGGNYIAISSLSDSNITKAVSISSPVFAAPTFTKDEFDNLWVFFGTGRYLDSIDRAISYTNYFVGFKDPCWDGSCSTAYSLKDLTNTTSINIKATVAEIKKICSCSGTTCGLVDVVYDTTPITSIEEVARGWYYVFSNEAVISQPAVYGGIVDALSFVPPQDICAFGGTTNLLALYYKSGTPYPRPAVLSSEAVSGQIIVGQTIIVKAKIPLGGGTPPFGNPFQIIPSGVSSREYTKFVQLSGAILEIKQKGEGGGGGRFISWIEK